MTPLSETISPSLRSCWRIALVLSMGAALAVLLASCGGGSSTNVASPGSGGTGIMASGPIAGFGSVIVNGTRFDDTTAKVTIDGSSVSSNQLRLGMLAHVEGIKSDATVTPTVLVKALGEANTIKVWSIAQGTVTQMISSKSFTVSGMTMLVDAGTVLEGAMSVSDLSTHTFVKAWGQPASADFTQWAVTRLEVLGSATDTITTGKVSVHTDTMSLNGYALAGNTSTLMNGQLVRAVGTTSIGTTGLVLTLSKIAILADNPSAFPASGYAELQGIVTSVLGTATGAPIKVTKIMLGAATVDLSNATVQPAGAQITEGLRVEVEGNWNAGVLVAKQVEVKSAQELQEVEIVGIIDQFTSVSNFTVRGQVCDASGLTFVGNGTLSNLRVGLGVHLHGLKNGNTVRITELDIN
jgi:Domain of unknown function (DUF5666)